MVQLSEDRSPRLNPEKQIAQQFTVSDSIYLDDVLCIIFSRNNAKNIAYLHVWEAGLQAEGKPMTLLAYGGRILLRRLPKSIPTALAIRAR